MSSGVPALINHYANVVALLVADAALIATQFQEPQWAILNIQSPPLAPIPKYALVPDSFVAVSFYRETAVSDYPQEQGAFTTYNKVQVPKGIDLVITKATPGFSFSKTRVPSKTEFLQKIDSMVAGLVNFDIVTPDAIYLNMNLTAYDYSRTSEDGAELLTINLKFREVRVTAGIKFKNTIDPNDKDAAQTGTVQATTPLSTPVPI
jgi:hypothetical protein